MKGSMRQRGPESWELRVYVGRVNGRPQLVSRTFKGTKRKAQTALSEMVAAHAQQTLATAPGRLTVGDWMRTWLDEHVKARVGARTWERYDELARLHVIPGLGSTPLRTLKPMAIQGFYGRLAKDGKAPRRPGGSRTGLNARTILHVHRLLFACLKGAVRMQLLTINPATAVEAPHVERTEATAIDLDRSEALLRAAEGTTVHIPVLLGLDCGLRRGEALALRWANVDLDGARLSVVESLQETKAGLVFKGPKSRSGRRVIGLPASTVEALRRHKARQAERRIAIGPLWHDHDLVCAGDDGQPMTPDYISKRFRALADSLSLPMRLHDTRHTAISHQLAAGVPLKMVSTLAGHSTVAITGDVYGHAMPGAERESVVKIEAWRATTRAERAGNK